MEYDLQVDGDKDGHLDNGEFVATYVQPRKICNDEEHLHKAFKFFDKNLNGFIEIEELQHCLVDDIEENSEEIINAIMDDVDTDKVGLVSLSLNNDIMFDKQLLLILIIVVSTYFYSLWLIVPSLL